MTQQQNTGPLEQDNQKPKILRWWIWAVVLFVLSCLFTSYSFGGIFGNFAVVPKTVFVLASGAMFILAIRQTAKMIFVQVDFRKILKFSASIYSAIATAKKQK